MAEEVDAERARLRARIAEERATWEQERAAEKEKHKLLAQAVEKKDGELSAKEDHLAGKDQELELSEGHLRRVGKPSRRRRDGEPRSGSSPSTPASSSSRQRTSASGAS